MEEKQEVRNEWHKQQRKLEQDSLLIPVMINKESFGKALADTGCEFYAIMSHGFAKHCNLPRIKISPRTLDGLTPTGWKIDEVT